MVLVDDLYGLMHPRHLVVSARTAILPTGICLRAQPAGERVRLPHPGRGCGRAGCGQIGGGGGRPGGDAATGEDVLHEELLHGRLPHQVVPEPAERADAVGPWSEKGVGFGFAVCYELFLS